MSNGVKTRVSLEDDVVCTTCFYYTDICGFGCSRDPGMVKIVKLERARACSMVCSDWTPKVDVAESFGAEHLQRAVYRSCTCGIGPGHGCCPACHVWQRINDLPIKERYTFVKKKKK